MPIIKQSENSFTLLPPGTHPSRCYAMISLGTQPSKNPQFKPAFKCLLQFEVPGETIQVSGKDKPMMTNHFVTAYLGSVKKPSKTNLFLTSWRGRAFTETELAGFDLAKVVGSACLLNIVHENRNGQEREVIASISPLPKGMTVPPQFNPSVVYEIHQGKDDVYRNLPEWVQGMISNCLEWSAPPAAAAIDEEADATVSATGDGDVPF